MLSNSGYMGVNLLNLDRQTELIAKTPEDYVRLAVALATDTERLQDLRAGSRARMGASSLCNGKAFTRQLEEAYREMWKTWCTNSNAPS